VELLPVLRLIWRRRLLLGVGVIAAVAILVGLGGTKSVVTNSATAVTSITLDTPKSQLVTAAPAGANTLYWRASLLAHLLATQSSTEALARQLGIRSDQVSVVDPALALPLVGTDTAQAAMKVATGVATPYVLTPYLPNSALPVISLEAAGPDAAGARRLAAAAVALLQSQAPQDARRFTSQVPTNAGNLRFQPFVVEQISPVQVKLVPSSSLPLKAIGGAFFFLFGWSGAVLLLPKLRRRDRPGRRPLPA
jgi:hypothetical protein